VTLPHTLGLVLAGGLARRIGGGDKALIRIGGTSILQRVVACLVPQCRPLILNANGDPSRFADTGLQIVADSVPDHPGPLAGILAGLDWAAAQVPEIDWLVSAPADCPFLPRDLVARLHRARLDAGTALACATSARRLHPVVGLWPVALRKDLRRALLNEGVRKVETWAVRHGVATADWPVTIVDPFFNVNTAADIDEANRIAAQMQDLDDQRPEIKKSKSADGTGAIRHPMRLRIGVSGHRTAPKLPAHAEAPLRALSDRLLTAIAAAARATEGSTATLVIVSSLAEGADRIVAEAGLAAGFGLQVVLPFPRAEYARDFATPQSRATFAALLARAASVVELDGVAEERSRAYEAAGLFMLANIDALIAVWDGEEAAGRGGTGQIVSRAVAEGRGVIWIDPRNAQALQVSWRGGSFQQADESGVARRIKEIVTPR
jgi:molybdopterin-guanine dinucleotide biosynthesis protein A